MRHVDWDAPEFAELSVTEKIQALVASSAALAVEDGVGVLPEAADEVTAGSEFVIPLLIPEELESGDGRKMEKGALSTRNLPITLLWQPATGDGHNGSFVVGRIDNIEEVEGGLGNARGVFDTGPYGREAERLVREKMLRGVSADLDMFEATIDENGTELSEDFDPNKIKNEKMTVNKARVMAATLVAKPAFQECTIELVSEDNMEDDTPLEDGVYEETPPESDHAEFALSSVIASAAPMNPPSAWFEDPNLDAPMPLTVTDDGHVFGHIATWDTSHVGLSNGVKPPRSRSNYAYFRTGLVKTIEGEDVAVGQLTLLGGHAPLDADAHAAVKHYDDTQSAVADVTAGEDQFGIWVAGSLRPSVTSDQVRTFRASAPSGDWRPINGTLELVAVCQVNVPGFPIARARVASGAVMALVAAGTSTLHKMRRSETDELSARLTQVEQAMLEQRRKELSSRFTPVREARVARLREAADRARQQFAPEFERKAQMSVDAEAQRKRFKEFLLDVKEDFKEELHPRDDSGQFRRVLAKLTEILKLEAGLNGGEAEKDLQRAADLEEKGDTKGAKAAGRDAKAKLDSIAGEAEGEIGDKIRDLKDELEVEDHDEDEGGEHRGRNRGPGGGDEKEDDSSGKGPAGGPKSDDDGPKVEVEVKSEGKDTAEDALERVTDKVEEKVKDTAKGDAPADAPAEGDAPADLDAVIDEMPEEFKELVELLIDELGENADPKSILSRIDNKMKHWIEGKGFDSPEAMIKLIEKMMQRPIQPDIAQ